LGVAILSGTVPGSMGTVDYTDPAITSWSTKGLVLIVTSGNTLDESEGGRLCLSLIDQSGRVRMQCARVLEGQTATAHNHNASHSDTAVRVMDADPAPGIGDWARAIFSAALGGGVRLDWTAVGGVAGREFRYWILLVDDLEECEVGDGAGSILADSFEPHALITAGIGALTAHPGNGNHFLGGFGAARDGSPIVQKSGGVGWDFNDDPTTAHAAVQSGSASTEITPPATLQGQVVTDFTATGFVDTGTGNSIWAALRLLENVPTGVALETLDGGTGAKVFTGLGVRPAVVVGLVTGNSADDSIESGAARSTLGLFVTDGTNTYSASASQAEGETITAGNPTRGYSRFSSSDVDVLDENGGTAFKAVVTSLDAAGLTLSVSIGMSGRMVLFAISFAPVLTPAPVLLGVAPAAAVLNLVREPGAVGLGLAVPSVARLLTAVPAPVVLGLAPAAPVRLTPIVPQPVVLGVSAALPSVVMPPPAPPQGEVRGPLAEAYLSALWDLLPRGHAWNRRPETVLGRLLRAWASEFELVEFRAQDAREEADTRTTAELLPEWEELLGTLEDCPSFDDVELERRFAVFLKYTMPGGQNAYHYSQVAQALGYDVDVEDLLEFDEFTCVSECDDSLTQGEWKFVVEVHAPVQTPRFFTADLSVADEPLVVFGNEALTCALDLIRPAHVLFLYVFDKPYVGYAPWSLLVPAPAALGLACPNPLRS